MQREELEGSMKRILFLYNPIAGQGKIKRNMYEVVEYYEKNDCIVTLCGARKLPKLIQEGLVNEENYDLVVCSGGDGTLNLVASTFQKENIPLPIGYLPAGSTNDYANSVGIPKDFKKACECTLRGNLKYLDMGKINGRFFLYVVGFGMFTKVSYATPQKNKNLLGHTAYILEGVKEFSDLKDYHLKLTCDECEVEGNFVIGLVTNSLSVGGFKNLLSSQVSMDDGMMEVLLVRTPANIFELSGILTAVLSDNVQSSDKIVYIKTRRLKITSDEKIDWTLDGEFGGRFKKVQIETIPHALPIYGE